MEQGSWILALKMNPLFRTEETEILTVSVGDVLVRLGYNFGTFCYIVGELGKEVVTSQSGANLLKCRKPIHRFHLPSP